MTLEHANGHTMTGLDCGKTKRIKNNPHAKIKPGSTVLPGCSHVKLLLVYMITLCIDDLNQWAVVAVDVVKVDNVLSLNGAVSMKNEQGCLSDS